MPTPRKKIGKPRIPMEERFWGFVNKNGPWHPILKSRCWVWTGYTRAGYGTICLPGTNAGMRGAPRYSWELHNGEILDGLWVLHHCDNKLCVRPSHLFLGTCQDNHDDAVKKGLASRNKGSSNHFCRLNEKQVLRIRALATLETRKATAKRFNISVNHVMQIQNRIRWKHLK